MDQSLKVALQAAHTAGDLIGRNFQKLQNTDIQHKGTNDFVTRIDKEAETIIAAVIAAHFSGHQILALILQRTFLLSAN